MFAQLLSFLGWGLIIVSILGHIVGRLSESATDGLCAIGFALCTISDVETGLRTGAVWNAAFVAVAGFAWWRGGGGTGTRRRLRAARRKFQGVRRTAPQHT